MKATIRDRRPGDLPRCIELLGEVHRLDRYPLNWPADPRGWLCPPDLLYAWIAEADSAAVVGHIAVHRLSTTAAVFEVGRLFVAPAFRRHHVASRLLQQVREWAVDRHADLMLEVVDGRGSAAITVYERGGWQHTHTTTADWTAPDGSPVTLRHYTLHH
ncbi:GNAT family N-acetyltransferase [Actinomycetes bacterium KLBMP 9797]